MRPESGHLKDLKEFLGSHRSVMKSASLFMFPAQHLFHSIYILF